MAIFLGAKPASTGGSGGRGRAVAPAPAQLRQQAAQQTAMLVGPQLIEAIEQYTAQAIRQRQMPVLEQDRIRLKLLVAQRQGELNHHRQRRGLTPPPESYQEYDLQQGEGEEPEQSEAPMPITATAGAALDQPQQIADDEGEGEGEWDNPELEEGEGEEEKEIEEVTPVEPTPTNTVTTAYQDTFGHTIGASEPEPEPEPGMVYRPYNESVPAQTNLENPLPAAAPLEDTIATSTYDPQPQTPSPLAGSGAGAGAGSDWAWSGSGPSGFAPPPQLTTAGLLGPQLPQPPTPPAQTTATTTAANWLNQATTPTIHPAPAPAPSASGPQGFATLVPPPPPILSIQPPPSILPNLSGAATPHPVATTDPKGAAGAGAGTNGPGTIAALVVAAVAFLILSLFGGTMNAPVAKAQAQAGSGYQLAVQVTIQQPATQTGAYKMQLERDGQPLLAVPSQTPTQPGVLRAVFIAGAGTGPGQTQATLVVRDDQGAIVVRKTEDWASLPPGGYSFGEVLSLGLTGATPGAGAGANAEDTAGHFLPQSGPVQAGLPTWATTALTSAGIAPLAQGQTSLALTPTAAGTNSKAATRNDQAPTQAQAQQMVMLHRNSPIPAFLVSFLMFGLAALLLIHLAQTGALPALIASWTAPRQPHSPKQPAALATATVAQGGTTAVTNLPTNAPIFAPTPTATAPLDPEEPEPADDTEMAAEESKTTPKAKKGFGFALGRKASNKKQPQAPYHSATSSANNQFAAYEPAPAPPPDPTGTVVAGPLNLAGLSGQAQAQAQEEEGDYNQPPFEGGAGLALTPTQRQPDSADLAATTTATSASANSTQTDWEFGLDLNGLGAANQGSPGIAGDGQVASLVIPRKLAASMLGASESRAQEQVAHYIEKEGSALLQAEGVRVNLEYALRSAARLLRVEQEYHTLENRYADNGAALDILVEVERTFMLPAGKKTGAAARPTTIKKFVAVEVDGPHHQLPGRERRDRLKNAFLEKAGVVLVRVRPGEFGKLQSDLAYIGEVLWLDELKRSGQLTRKGQAHSQSGAVRLSRADQGLVDDEAATNKGWFIFAGGSGSKGGRGQGAGRSRGGGQNRPARGKSKGKKRS